MGLSAARRPRRRRPRAAALLPSWPGGGLRAERGTWALAVASVGLTAAAVATEVARAYRRQADHAELLHPLETADIVVRDAVAVAVAGYEEASTRENALLNLLASFSLTFGLVRLGTYRIRRRGRLVGSLGNVFIGGRHVHHFVPGIALALLAGGASILSRNENLDPLLAVPFGVGAALTLDESALLLTLDDVYWTRQGLVSVQITLSALALTSATALVVRALARGEQAVAGGTDG